MYTTIYISSLPIRLGQFLKLVDIVTDGMEAKRVIQNGEVAVNNALERRRGRQLLEGDTVQMSDGTSFVIAQKS